MHLFVRCSAGLVDQRSMLVAEIRSMREDHELAVNALKVTHQLNVQSLTDELETKLASGLPPSSCDLSVTGGFAA